MRAPCTTSHLSLYELAKLIGCMIAGIVGCMEFAPLMLVCFGSIS